MSDVFISKRVKANELVDLTLDKLKTLNISKERAHQLLAEVQKEIERKSRLEQKLKEVDCEEILDNLVKFGSTSKDVFSLDNNALAKSGLSTDESEKALAKIQIAKEIKINGNL